MRGFIAAAEACGTLYPLSSLLFPIYLKVRFKSLVHFCTMTLPDGSMWKNQVFDRIVLKQSFGPKHISWTTWAAPGPILAFSSHFRGIFVPRVGFGVFGPIFTDLGFANRFRNFFVDTIFSH